MRTHLGIFFHSQSIGKKKSAVQLWKSADIKLKSLILDSVQGFQLVKDSFRGKFSLQIYPVHGFQLVKTHLGVVSHGQSIGKDKSAVQL